MTMNVIKKIKDKTVLIPIFLLIICLGIIAFPYGRLPANTMVDGNIINTSEYNCLKNASIFTDGPTGAGGSKSAEIEAFEALLKNPFARNIFLELEKEATNEGKLYALCGLCHLDKPIFNNLISKYQFVDEYVECMGGCMRYKEKMSKIIKNSGSNRYDFYEGAIPSSLLRYINR